MALTAEQERAYVADLKKLGRTQVRSELDHGRISPALVHIASGWLAEEERDDDRRREAFNSEQIEIARAASAAAERASEAAERAATAAERQAVAAERANTRATLALIIAIISAAITALRILVTHWDAHK